MPERTLPPHTSIGQTAAGRWWSQCTRPYCQEHSLGYTAGLATKQAAIGAGSIHQAMHDRSISARASGRVRT